MDCVLFSSWVPEYLISRGEQYLRYLYQYFGDCEIFCGVNSGSSPNWLDMIEHYKRHGLNIEYKYVAPSLASTSDNAGYQAALSLYKLRDRNYELAFFTHTKSISHQENNHKEGVEHLVVSFHKNRKRVSDLLHSNRRYGGWSPIGTINYEHINLNKVSEYFSFPCEALPQTFVLTSYAIKNLILRSFVEDCKADFFTYPYEFKGYNRYFFEFYFPSIISKMGFIPLVDEFWACENQKMARVEMLANFDQWKVKSQFTEHLVYPISFDGMKV